MTVLTTLEGPFFFPCFLSWVNGYHVGPNGMFSLNTAVLFSLLPPVQVIFFPHRKARLLREVKRQVSERAESIKGEEKKPFLPSTSNAFKR